MSSEIESHHRLYRSVHPEEFDNGRVSSSAFNPSEEHDYKLSLDRATMTSAKDAFLRQVVAGRKSVGIFGVHCADFSVESIPCLPDPIPGNDSHAVADFGSHGTNARRKKARRLAEIATKHGFDFKP